MTSDVRMLVGSEFYLGVKERPPGLAPSCAVQFRAAPMTKVAEPRQQLNPTFSKCNLGLMFVCLFVGSPTPEAVEALPY